MTWSGSTATVGADQIVMTAVGSTQNQWIYNTPLNGVQLGSTTQIRVGETHRVMNTVQSGAHIHGVLGTGPCVSACGA